MPKGKLERQIALRLAASDLARLERLTEKIAVGSRNAVARQALRLGLDALEADPSQVFEGGTKTRRRGK